MQENIKNLNNNYTRNTVGLQENQSIKYITHILKKKIRSWEHKNYSCIFGNKKLPNNNEAHA